MIFIKMLDFLRIIAYNDIDLESEDENSSLSQPTPCLTAGVDFLFFKVIFPSFYRFFMRCFEFLVATTKSVYNGLVFFFC